MKPNKGVNVKNWISKWLMFVSAGHTAVAMMFFGNIYSEIIANGLFNTVTSEKIGLSVWFLLFGFLLFIVSLLISVIEKNETLEIPNIIGVSLLILTTLGVVLMPVSGFWLVYPAALAIIIKNQKLPQHIKT